PCGTRTRARAAVVGRARPDRGPGTNAADRAPDVALVSGRRAQGLRGRRQHGRTGEPPPARTPSASARGSGRVRLGHRLRAPVLLVPATRLREALPASATR